MNLQVLGKDLLVSLMHHKSESLGSVIQLIAKKCAL